MRSQHPAVRGHRVESLESRRLLSAGDLDTSFAGDGIAETQRDTKILFNDAVLLGNDKTLFVGGTSELFVAQQNSYVLRRFNANGTLDTTFGTNGTAAGHFASGEFEDSTITEAVVQPDGKIVAIGHSTSPVIARFNANGTLDTSFAGDGIVEAQADHVTVQSDGKIIVYGNNVLTRYNVNGTPDTSFGTAGSTSLAGGRTLKVQADNKILVAGSAIASQVGERGAMWRLNADGKLDASFGTAGRAISLAATSFGDVIQLAGGKYVAGATDEGQFLLVRFNSDGTLDASFAGGGGSVLIQGDFQSRPAIHEQADGKLLIAADSFSGFAATRTDANGLLDATFGRVFREVGSNALFVRGSGIDSNGKLIIAGAQNTFLQGGITVGETFIARLLTNDNAPTAITLNPTTRVLSIPGTSGNDAIHVTEDGSTVFPSLNGFGRMFQQTAVGSVSVTAGDGDDVIIIGPGTIPTRISGGNGSDRITGGDRADTIDGNGGPDFIDGGNGADLISGGAGNDAIRGEEGNDTIDGGDGDDELRGGPGDDTYVPSAGTDTNVDLDLRDVTLVDGLLKFFDSRNGDDQVSLWDDGAGNLVIYVDGLTNQVDIDLVDRIELNGNGGNDLLKLNPGLFIPATIFGGEGGRTSVGGNDTVIGGACDDYLQGNSGDDFVFGNGGDDLLEANFGGSGSDVVRGGAGRDTIDYSGHGNLRVTVDDLRDDGEAGENDLVFTDVERVFGGGGDDFISGGSGLSILYGGDGSDTLLGNGGFDALYGGGGNDRLDGGAGDDYLEGGAGNDVLNGGPGADQLFALAGNDTLLSDDGTKDTVRGGTGTDVADVDLIDDVVGVESAGDGSRNVG